MNQQHLNTNHTNHPTCSWNRQRSDAELTSFVNRKLAELANISLVD